MRTGRLRVWLVSGALVLAVAAIYAQTGRFDFVNYDDGEYVYENPVVRDGLTAHGMTWAFGMSAANWHPLTWLSHMLDVQVFGVDPGAHHLVSAALHALTSVVILLTLRSLTGSFWPSALVAALFAVHPLNVESVAWVSERKNVLSTIFWFATVGAYARWVRRPNVGRYLLVAGALALGLLCKQMLITLPLVLLLLDVWPLGRLSVGGLAQVLRGVRPLLLEKVPLLSLSLVAGLLTIRAQASWHATQTIGAVPLVERTKNALLGYGFYLGRTIWPFHLSFFYPHPAMVHEAVPAFASFAAGLGMFCATLLAVVAFRRLPYVTVGWLWFVLTLLPVIGIVQVGPQARADRYAYVPLVGLFIAASWSITELLAKDPRLRDPIVAFCCAAIVALSVAARSQTRTWRDGEALYGHAVRLDPRNWLAWNNLGTTRLARGDNEKALACFRQSAAIKPDYEDAYYNAGVALALLDRKVEAVAAYHASLGIDPGNADAWVNLGSLHLDTGRVVDAIACYQRALAVRPDDPIALEELMRAYMAHGDRDLAARTLMHLREVAPATGGAGSGPARTR